MRTIKGLGVGGNKPKVTLLFMIHHHMKKKSCSEKTKKQLNQHGIDCFNYSRLLNQDQQFRGRKRKTVRPHLVTSGQPLFYYSPQNQRYRLSLVSL